MLFITCFLGPLRGVGGGVHVSLVRVSKPVILHVDREACTVAVGVLL